MNALQQPTTLVALAALYAEQQKRVFDHRRAERDDPGTDQDTHAEIEDEVTALDRRAEALLAVIAARPAWTMDEIRAKARCVVAYTGEVIGRSLRHTSGGDDVALCLSIISDLVGAPAIADALSADGQNVEHLRALPVPANPDAALLELCRRLGEQQGEWQRLYATIPTGALLRAPEHEVWATYASTVWPGVGPAMTRMHAGDDLPAQLVEHRAMTQAGMAAKAAAILALQEAAHITMDCRDDHCALADSLMEDVAGAAYRPIGEAS